MLAPAIGIPSFAILFAVLVFIRVKYGLFWRRNNTVTTATVVTGQPRVVVGRGRRTRVQFRVGGRAAAMGPPVYTGNLALGPHYPGPPVSSIMVGPPPPSQQVLPPPPPYPGTGVPNNLYDDTGKGVPPVSPRIPPPACQHPPCQGGQQTTASGSDPAYPGPAYVAPPPYQPVSAQPTAPPNNDPTYPPGGNPAPSSNDPAYPPGINPSAPPVA